MRTSAIVLLVLLLAAAVTASYVVFDYPENEEEYYDEGDENEVLGANAEVWYFENWQRRMWEYNDPLCKELRTNTAVFGKDGQIYPPCDAGMNYMQINQFDSQPLSGVLRSVYNSNPSKYGSYTQAQWDAECSTQCKKASTSYYGGMKWGNYDCGCCVAVSPGNGCNLSQNDHKQRVNKYYELPTDDNWAYINYYKEQAAKKQANNSPVFTWDVKSTISSK